MVKVDSAIKMLLKIKKGGSSLSTGKVSWQNYDLGWAFISDFTFV